MNGTNSTANYLPSLGFSIGMILFICVCITIGVIGNIGVIVYNIFMNHSKTSTTYFVVNLAISDIIVCITFFPSSLVQNISNLANLESNHLQMICKINMTSACASIALSIVNLLAITGDRYLFITKPLKYPMIMTLERMRMLLSSIWILAIVNVNFVFFNTEEIPRVPSACRFKELPHHVFFLINVFLPTGGLFYFNYKIYRTAKSQNERIKSESRTSQSEAQKTSQNAKRKERLQQMKLVKTFAIVLGVFIACLLPMLILYIATYVICKRSCIPKGVIKFSVIIIGTNSVMNPFIYSLRNKEYRIVYRKLFSRIFERTSSVSVR